MAGKRRQRRAFGKIAKKGNRFYAEYTGPDGAKHTPGRSFASRTDAEGWLHAERRLIDHENWSPAAARRQKQEENGITVGDWLGTFYYQQPYIKRWKLTTANKYREHVEYRITGDHLQGTSAGRLQGIPLADVTRKDIFDWWDAINTEYPDADSQNYNGYVRLRQALKEAVLREMIPFNPAADCGIARPVSEDKYLPRDEEIFKLIDAVPERYQFMAVLTLAHGLRLGEATGLERSHLSIVPKPVPYLPEVSVSIRQDAEYTQDRDGKMHHLIGEVKTPAARRDVPILAKFVPIVLKHVALFALEKPIRVVTEDGQREALMLNVTSRGRLVAPTQFQEDIREARAATGIAKSITPHSGRNWLITKLLEMGVPTNQIGRMLGQVDQKTIMHYAKMHNERPRQYIERLNDLI